VALDPQLQLAITQVVDLADHIGAISAGILALSITFLKDVLHQPDKNDRRLITSAWVGYLLAIVFGIWTRMAVLGSLTEIHPLVEIGDNIRDAAKAQIIAFVGSTVIFIVLAQRGLRRADSRVRSGTDKR
jgi:hypothetical protein